jgi:hypothetical protein
MPRNLDDVFARVIIVETKLDAHIASKDLVLNRMDTNLQSLLETRSFTRGVVKTALMLSAGISAAVSSLMVYWGLHVPK